MDKQNNTKQGLLISLEVAVVTAFLIATPTPQVVKDSKIYQAVNPHVQSFVKQIADAAEVTVMMTAPGGGTAYLIDRTNFLEIYSDYNKK